MIWGSRAMGDAPQSGIVAAGPFTLEEAQAVLSSLPPPAPEAQLSPAADYTGELPADVERCGCEESEALHAELVRVARLKDVVQGIGDQHAVAVIEAHAREGHLSRLLVDAEERVAKSVGRLQRAEARLAKATALLNRWRFHDRRACQASLCWETDAFVGEECANG